MPQTPRPELMALLADAKENPDDLTPWLVLCDWLEENGDEADRARGEYCRLCFDKLGTKTYASDWEKGERRRALYRQYHQAWLGPIKLLRPEIRKGLLDVRTEHTAKVIEIANSDEERWAWVSRLGLSHRNVNLGDASLGKAIRGLHTLELVATLRTEEAAVRLADSPFLANVRELRVAFLVLTEAVATRLAESPHLMGLRCFHVALRRGRDADRMKMLPTVRAILRAKFGKVLRLSG